MRASAALALVLLATVPASAESLVYRVDKATAVIEGDHLVISATGAVKSGGWEKPRLVLRKAPQVSAIEVAFTATPPQDRAAVIQSLLPISVSLKMHAPRSGVATVRVVSETNTVTAEIVAKYVRQKTAER